MLKITRVESNGHGATLRLEGRLVGPWVAELERFADPRQLDLTGVVWANREGIALLRDLARRGVELRGAAEFIARQLAEPEGER